MNDLKGFIASYKPVHKFPPLIPSDNCIITTTNTSSSDDCINTSNVNTKNNTNIKNTNKNTYIGIYESDINSIAVIHHVHDCLDALLNSNYLIFIRFVELK